MRMCVNVTYLHHWRSHLRISILYMVPKFQKKKKGFAPRHTWLHVGGVVVLIVSAVLVVANIKMYQKKQAFLAQVTNLKNQIEDIQSRNSQLNKGISQSDDQDYIEKVAREQLDLQKPGEKAVSFVAAPDTTVQTSDNNQASVQYWFGWIGASWQWIKNNF